MRSWCPYCNFYAEADSPEALTKLEIQHMQAAHPDIIEQRLREAGELPPESDD